MLEQSDIAHYLLSLSVVKPQTVIDEDFRVVDASRRNSVFLATTRSGPTFVVKQSVSGDTSSLAHEATVLRLLAGAPALAPHVPEVVCFDGSCLVLATRGGAQPWSDLPAPFRRLPARQLGRLLAGLHTAPTDGPAAPDPIWGLQLTEPPRSLVLQLSAAAQDLLARVQASDFLAGRLAELRAESTADAFTHGDLRWDNCLVHPVDGRSRASAVLVVDWECAGRADPAYDVGSVFAEYLRAWLSSVPIVEPLDPGRLVDRARYPLASIRPSVRAFWSVYRSATLRPPPLRRAVELTAVRLLQVAIEAAQGLAAATAHVVTMLQLADNMLRRPDVAATALLGLEE